MTRTGQDAIDYTRDRVGDEMPEGSGYCLKFVRQDYAVPALYASAIDAWNAAPDQHPGDRNPPPGVPVYFRTPSIYDHVCFYVGPNEVISTFNEDIRAFPGIASIEANFDGTYLGWASNHLNAVDVTPGHIPPPPPDDDERGTAMQHLLWVRLPDGQEPYYLVDYAAGTGQRIWQQIQLDFIRRDPHLDDASGGVQPHTVLQGLTLTGE